MFRHRSGARPGGRRARATLRALFPALLGLALLAPSAEAAPRQPSPAPVAPRATDGPLGEPSVTPLGTFGGIPYVRYDGVFEGRTSTGRFRVPYRISAPQDPSRTNGTVLVEPPHFAVGLGTLNGYLRPELLFPRGFVHAGIGWSTFANRILDPSVPGTFIEGGFDEEGARVDDEIITEFGRALARAPETVGKVSRRYVAGASDSSYPVLRLIASGDASGVFDLAMPFTTDTLDPQADIAAGRYRGKVVVVNSEADDSSTLTDRGVAPAQYRFYVVAGSPHVPDLLGANPPGLPVAGTTPATWVPALRAHFLQGHDWVRRGSTPPVSTRLRTVNDGTVVRDARGNAITEDTTGRTVPRLPFVELGEARFIPGFLGSYEDVRTVQQLAFPDHRAYRRAFDVRVRAYLRAGYILPEDANAMRRRAHLCPPSTYTETYRDHYDAFVALTPCSAA
ncbi:alpha/beta hydrolase domain-containing protein [Streptomyces vilmorinianum]|uniref:alpha/beta hydrolase domain-containing protein n=1 Tax=Streptomyces vilmorinianum TaxID=3051092 RepID=UPI0010FB2785|nr:alpha/beta hydrolase domain-containing protein [Streptomyces vilmorinianum]